MRKFKTLLPIFFLLFSLHLFAEDESPLLAIDFKPLGFEAAKALAKQSGKPIFMDVFAVWCIPCKQFEKTVFTNKEVGEKFNSWFINLKIDAEKEEGKKIFSLYKVGGYPTGIFITADGTLLSKFEGVLPKNVFIEYAENALELNKNPTGYTTALNTYLADKTDLNNIRALLRFCNLSGNTMPLEAMDRYFASCSKSIVETDSTLLRKWLRTSPIVISGKETYSYFLKQNELINKVISVDTTYLSGFFYNSLQSSLQAAISNKDELSLQKVLRLNSELPRQFRQAENIEFELNYYLETKELQSYFQKMNVYCRANYSKKIFTKNSDEASKIAARINNFGWNYFMYADKKEDLMLAATIMENCISLDSSFAAWYDTYAGIVYKMGDVNKAVELENKAVFYATQSAYEQQIYRSKIERMKRGEKIWIPEQY